MSAVNSVQNTHQQQQHMINVFH